VGHHCNISGLEKIDGSISSGWGEKQYWGHVEATIVAQQQQQVEEEGIMMSGGSEKGAEDRKEGCGLGTLVVALLLLLV
jgi:hypothetical protein